MSEISAGDAVTTAATAVGWRRAGIAGAAIGVIAAGAAAGVAVERLTVGRGMRRRARLALDASGPYGSLRGLPGRANADDGTELYYEVDEVDPDGGTGPPGAVRAPGTVRPLPAPPARAAAGSSAARRPGPSPSSSATGTASARTPGTSSGRRCAESSVPSTGTSAATAAPSGAGPVRTG